MYKSLSPSAFGVSGRQSELIELALTHGFRSIEVDVEDLLKKAEKQGIEHAARFLTSAQLKLGSFELPIKWRGEEGPYKAELHRLIDIAAQLAKIGARVCHTTVYPASENLPYHENFERHRQRLAEISRVLGEHKIRLGVYLLAAPVHRQGRQYPFIHEAEALVTLIKSVGEANAGLYLDTWNWHFGGGTLEQLRALGKQIVAVSFADAPEGVSADEVTEEQRLMPGPEGVIDNAAYLKLMSEVGCNGPATVVPHGKCFSGMTREAIVLRCSSALDEIWKEAGLVKAPKPVPALSST